jgi:hypothetical protein
MKSLIAIAAFVVLVACARTPEPTVPVLASAPAKPAAIPVPIPTPTAESAVTVLVHKSPTCSCCSGWVDHLRQAGFVVQVDDTDVMDPIKSRLGVPAEKAACHTAEVGGYFIEGHVPASDIRRLLAEKPAARGLAVPGMPMGSPGMGEPGSGSPYTVELIAADGSSRPFQQH